MRGGKNKRKINLAIESPGQGIPIPRHGEGSWGTESSDTASFEDDRLATIRDEIELIEVTNREREVRRGRERVGVAPENNVRIHAQSTRYDVPAKEEGRDIRHVGDWGAVLRIVTE